MMWKYNTGKDAAIEGIRQKRCCVDINIGFVVQLEKWDELLKFGKEFKFFKFEKHGNLSLIDVAEFQKKVLPVSFSTLLMLRENKFYRLINARQDTSIEDKVGRFVTFLQTYENYPTQLDSLYVNADKWNSVDYNPVDIDEILKNCCY